MPEKPLLLKLETIKYLLSEPVDYMGIFSEMNLLEAQVSEIDMFKEQLLANSQIQETFLKESTGIIYEKALKGKKLLQNQIFSQSLTESLVNDLLDLAKLENNSFTFNKAYFNLGTSIYEAF